MPAALLAGFPAFFGLLALDPEPWFRRTPAGFGMESMPAASGLRGPKGDVTALLSKMVFTCAHIDRNVDDRVQC